jgi:hypothetical protein
MPCGGWGVLVVAEDRVSLFGEVDTDLVPAAGLQCDADQRGTIQLLLDAVMRDGVLTRLVIRDGKSLQVFPGPQTRAERPR